MEQGDSSSSHPAHISIKSHEYIYISSCCVTGLPQRQVEVNIFLIGQYISVSAQDRIAHLEKCMNRILKLSQRIWLSDMKAYFIC